MIFLRNFFSSNIAAGLLLALATLLALIVANTPLNDLYEQVFYAPFLFDKSFQFIINDALMVIFFLLIGLEVKREIVAGHLSSLKNASLPIIAAAGGAIVPALIYAFINRGDSDALAGWAVPTATDIAFALGLMTILGSRIPNSLKICLVTIAVVDDLFAVIIIALFYTADISIVALLCGAIGLGIAIFLNVKKVTRLTPYLVIAVIVWACVLKSGIHPTIAGVAMGLIIPMKTRNKDGESPSVKLEHLLHLWVSFLILPLFAFANAGISLTGLSAGDFIHPITLGIMMGLLFGKQIGILAATFLACRFKIARLPKNSTWKQYYGMALLTGIGFTMSLFIGTLAFPAGEQMAEVKLGVLCGSFLSAIAGVLVLLSTTHKETAET